METRHRRQIRNYLLDRKFQLRYTLVIVVTSAMLSAGLGYFWYGEMRHASRIVEVQALGALSETDAAQIERDLRRQDRRRLVILVGFGVVLALLLGGYGIMFTHKVAGPLHKMQRYLRDMRDGRLHVLHELRRGDQLQSLWDDVKELHDAFRQRTQQELGQLESAIREIEASLVATADATTSRTARDALEEPLQRLRRMRDDKRATLGPTES